MSWENSLVVQWLGLSAYCCGLDSILGQGTKISQAKQQGQGKRMWVGNGAESLHFSSVALSCPTLWDPMDYITPGFPVHQQLPELAQTHPSSQWHHLTISSSIIPFSSCLQSFPALGSFPMSWLFTSDGQSTGALASASVIPMSIQGWFKIDWFDLLVFQDCQESSPASVGKHQFFGLCLLYCLALTFIHDSWKDHSLEHTDLHWQSDVFAF